MRSLGWKDLFYKASVLLPRTTSLTHTMRRAWMMIPNIWTSRLFGKVLFVLTDLAIAYLIGEILRMKLKRTRHQLNGSNNHRETDDCDYLENTLQTESPVGSSLFFIICYVMICHLIYRKMLISCKVVTYSTTQCLLSYHLYPHLTSR